MSKLNRIEWPTVAMLAFTYLIWGVATVWVAQWSLPVAMIVVAIAGAQHSSLQHEVLHGHPTTSTWLNEAMVFPALTVAIPYIRFRDSHLAHHQDSILTDPYDDPESNFQDPAVWNSLPMWWKKVLGFNNTLAGRMLVGPIVAQIAFMFCDWRAIKSGDRAVLNGWLWHFPALALVLWWIVSVSAMPVWAFLIAAYVSLSILKIRTYLEHQAHDRASGRTVIIEDRGPLALIFLNNNLHIVHHMHPRVAWYRLPKLYFANPERYLSRNDGYRFRNYNEIFKKFLLRAKDPVPHPLWRK
ncbi:MAG: fatty acid desaturase [Paracoccaceae bacterium]|nr:fatty acid desaturase [Paracoccaceae bacterium]MDG1737550.1 fatty acid desaturase [Paracoccaceae bacterium]MDG2257480.1 fatty acid desaturase [Paracoccaceae bacterium]